MRSFGFRLVVMFFGSSNRRAKTTCIIWLVFHSVAAITSLPFLMISTSLGLGSCLIKSPNSFTRTAIQIQVNKKIMARIEKFREELGGSARSERKCSHHQQSD